MRNDNITPEQWIIDQWGEAWVRNQWDASDVISSLEEFAEAYHKERMDDLRDKYTEETFDLRDELIKFGEWLSTESSPIIFNMRNTVDEYLTLPKIKKG